jgi:hypothetical protein
VVATVLQFKKPGPAVVLVDDSSVAQLVQQMLDGEATATMTATTVVVESTAGRFVVSKTQWEEMKEEVEFEPYSWLD